MNAPAYMEILEKILLPCTEEVYPDFLRFIQDNDPKHTSNMDKAFLNSNRLDSSWITVPKNLWQEIKEYIRSEVKPKTKDEFMNCIAAFWGSVSGEKYAPDKVIVVIKALKYL